MKALVWHTKEGEKRFSGRTHFFPRMVLAPEDSVTQTNMQRWAEDGEPPILFPLRSRSGQKSERWRSGSHNAAVLPSRHSRVPCVRLFQLESGLNADSTLPGELWRTEACCNVFTMPLGSLVLLSLNDQFT